MYADRYARPEGVKFGSLSIAIGVNVALMSAFVFMSPAVKEIIAKGPLETWNVPIDPPPPVEVPPETKALPQHKTVATPERIETVKPIVTGSDPVFPIAYDPPPPGPLTGIGGGPVTIVDPPVATPVLVEARVDPRYAADLQPAYPAGERRAENEGRVVIKVLIGTDGRVKQAVRVSATSDAFWRATEERAFAKWRFRPATRDGVPVEGWRTMTLRFELQV